MIKKIIQLADIHIKKTMDNWENEMYSTQLEKFILMCKDITENYKREEIRIVICGDLFHNKNNISNDLDYMASNFIRELEKIAPIRIIAGNHDYNANNIDQTNTITTFCETRGFNDTLLLDEVLNYRSGCITDDNIVWCVYSSFDNFIKPDILTARQENKNHKFIGLYHDMVNGAKLENGFIIDSGINDNAFEGCDCVMAGHIHKRQVIRKKGIDIVYCGSLIQQDFGETTSQHGFCVWDIETMIYDFVDLPSEYGYYNLELNNIDDIENDKIKQKNL